MGYFRELKASEIDCRVATIGEKGLTLLLYKDARVDQNMLDEKFGIFGWKREHQLIGDNLYCTVSVKDPQSGEWISKQDVGTESFTESEKGQASDSFKRACFNLGIGRELYTAPFIFIPNEKVNITEGKNGKKTTYDTFSVAEVGYTDGSITSLVIVNNKTNKQVFDMKPLPKMQEPKSTKKAETKKEEPKKEETVDDVLKRPGMPTREQMIELVKRKFPAGTDKEAEFLEWAKVKSVEEAESKYLMTMWSKYNR